jgi:quinol monooxygenase YgiN
MIMTIARHYVMIAADGQEAALEANLSALADALRGVPGCEGIDLMRDCANPQSFTFIEKWTSIEVHKAAGAQLPKELMALVMGALAQKPVGASLEYLKTI